MISRLTTVAAIFAVLTTTTLALAATSVQRAQASRQAIAVTAASTPAMPVVQLETVVVTGRRTAASAAR